MRAQEAQQSPPEPPSQTHGTVLMQRDGSEAAPALAPARAAPAAETIALTDAERDAPTFTMYDLDVHLRPAASSMTVHARLRVRNDGAAPLTRLAMQVSSSLRWESVSVLRNGTQVAQTVTQQTVDTDADHTGRVSEVVIPLAEPLAPRAEATLDVFYGGTIQRSSERLDRIGAPSVQSTATDWDAIGAETTSLRGFGDVIWYPVASAPVFLGDGARLFDAAGRAKLRQAAATVHLRLTVEYAGAVPVAAYFCGRREPLVAVSDDADLPVAQAQGVATAEFGAQALGFRVPSLFLTDREAAMTADGLIAVVTARDDVLPSYAAAAKRVQPMLEEWLGAAPLAQLTLLDHAGQPFEDGTFVAAPLGATTGDALAAEMAHLLAHAWFRSSRPWLDEGVAEFASLLWVERTQGRDAAIGTLRQMTQTLAIADVVGGPSLLTASNEVYYRTKAAAVLWMLRGIVGDAELRQALRNYRGHAALDKDDDAFERELEAASGKDLRWFFNDWVYHDVGLPDLSIVSVVPGEIVPAQGGHPGRWVIAVQVRNDGDAAAEVPVTVDSGGLSSTEQLLVAGRSTALVRVSLPAVPDEVVVNDGSVPEVRATEHRRKITVVH